MVGGEGEEKGAGGVRDEKGLKGGIGTESERGDDVGGLCDEGGVRKSFDEAGQR